jgi:hypothetical protein
MLMLHQSRPYFRFLSLLTILTFFPSSVAVWNFVPPSWDVVEAEEVADAANTATDAALEDSPPGLSPKILTQEELAAISGGPAAGATGHAATPASNRLPEMRVARSLPKPPAIITDPDVASVPAEPIRLAQAGDPVQPAGLDAQLAAADMQRDAGNLADAYLGYLGVLNDYPEAWLQGVVDARDRIKDMAKTLTEAEFQALNEIARDFTLLHGPLAVRGTNEFYRAWAEACKERGDLDGWAWRTQEVMARTMWGMVRYPNDLDVRRLFSWYLTAANDLGMRVEGEETLKDFLLKQEPSVITFEGWARLSEKASAHGDNGQRIICAANALASAGTLDVVFDNPLELQKEKAELANRLGQMYEDVGMLDEAIAQYRDLQDRFPVPPERAAHGNAVYDAGIRVAQKIARMSRNDVYPGILAYSEFIQRYPNGPLVNQARFEMAGLYALAGDYRQAASLYRELVADDPGQEERVWPELNFLLTYLYDSVEVASGQPVASPEQTKLAQMCGPSALQKLLKTQGVEVSQSELAELAGTDETGTTMLGLVEAAKAKGLELAGVEAPEAGGLPQPFIAYVNHNHFLVVREVRDDSVVVLDLDKPETAFTRAEFARMWDGMALVRADASPQIAKLLNPEEQIGAKGGTEGSNPPPPPPPCEDDGECPGCQGGGGSGGGGGGGCSGGGGGGGVPDGGGSCGPNGPSPAEECPCEDDDDTPGNASSPTSRTGVSSPGVHPIINSLQTGLVFYEMDQVLDVKGALTLEFQRAYFNPFGYHRTEFQGTTKPWNNNIGDGWTHNLNMHLLTSYPYGGRPSTVVFYDPTGAERTYTYSTTSGGYNWYVPATTSYTSGKGNTLKRNTTTLKWTLERPSGLAYEFSAATTDTPTGLRGSNPSRTPRAMR